MKWLYPLAILMVLLSVVPAMVMVYEQPTHQYEHRTYNPFITIVGDKFYLGGKVFVPKGVNYFPRDYGWNKMWDHFFSIENVIDTDMARAHALGINVVRIIIQYNAFGGGKREC